MLRFFFFVLQGSYLCDEIETTWGRPCPKDFVDIPSYIRMDLLTRLRNYAELIDVSFRGLYKLFILMKTL